MRIALGLSYAGQAYEGWQSQLSGKTVQDQLERALKKFSTEDIRTHCAGRTDTGVHGVMQVVHFDTAVEREDFSWQRGVNRFLPPDIAVQWAKQVDDSFHCRSHALSRAYSYQLYQSPVRPSLEHGRVGWTIYPLDLAAMQAAAAYLLGEHDFSSFRASSCQALSPVKNLMRMQIQQQAGAYAQSVNWRFDFEANAFLHHMIRNIMGCLVFIGQGKYPPSWMSEVLAAKDRNSAAPTFSPDGLYFLGPRYAPEWGIVQPEAWPGIAR